MYRLEKYRKGKLFEVHDPVTLQQAQYYSKQWKREPDQTVELRVSTQSKSKGGTDGKKK